MTIFREWFNVELAEIIIHRNRTNMNTSSMWDESSIHFVNKSAYNEDNFNICHSYLRYLRQQNVKDLAEMSIGIHLTKTI